MLPRYPYIQELDVDFVPAQATCVILVAEDEAVALNTKFLRDRLTSAKNYSKPIVLVWQSPTCMSGYEAIQRIASLEFRVPVIPVSTTEDVVAFLTLTLDQEADSRSQNTITVTKKDKTSAEQTNQKLLCFVKKIPGVGSKKAQELLSRFPSLALMANATEGWFTLYSRYLKYCTLPTVSTHNIYCVLCVLAFFGKAHVIGV